MTVSRNNNENTGRKKPKQAKERRRKKIAADGGNLRERMYKTKDEERWMIRPQLTLLKFQAGRPKTFF